MVGSGGWILPGALITLLVLALTLAVAARAFRSWRSGRRRNRTEQRGIEQRTRDAIQLLIATDEELQGLGQELDFAEAAFDPVEVEPLRAASGQARSELAAAFSTRRQLDEAAPKELAQRAILLDQIVAHSERVHALTVEQRGRIEQLREQQRHAPEELVALDGQLAGLAARLPLAEATMQRLQGYAPACWQPVAGNLEVARVRVAAATSATQRGQQALAGATKDLRAAHRARREAESAVSEAGPLLDEIDLLAASLAEARERLDAELRDAGADLEAARTALRSAAQGPDPAGRLSAAEAALQAARMMAAQPTVDVLAAFATAQRAHATADEILADVRRAEEGRTRQEAILQATLASARANVAHAADFIEARRPTVGQEPRVRLAQAQQSLDQAEAATAADPATALVRARVAERLADEARALADAEAGGGGYMDALPVDPSGAIIGGILLGGLGRGGPGCGVQRGGHGWTGPGRGGHGRGGC